ncbi:MAG: hypothetical protein AAF417_21650 [Pseudomonadota bacterium]
MTKPQGAIGRWFDVFFLLMAGAVSFYNFYLIHFRICRDYECESLVVTSYYASAPWWYLVFGVSVLGVAFFIHETKNLPRVFALAITLCSLCGFVLSGMVVFAILKEVKTVL